MSLAIIKTGGKQYIVKAGQELKVEKLLGEVGAKISFDEVLFVSDDKGDIEIGLPTLAGKKVEAEILEQSRGRKILVVKFKNKVRYRRKQGHRQFFTKVKINKI